MILNKVFTFVMFFGFCVVVVVRSFVPSYVGMFPWGDDSATALSSNMSATYSFLFYRCALVYGCVWRHMYKEHQSWPVNDDRSTESISLIE